MMEDDEDMLVFSDDKESEILSFVKTTITTYVKDELKIVYEVEDQAESETSTEG